VSANHLPDRICIACSIEVVLPAVLAILKAGGEYMPLGLVIKKVDWRLAVNEAGLGKLLAACPSGFSRIVGYDPETRPGTMLTPRVMIPWHSRPYSFT
jgi:hypothetical protein